RVGILACGARLETTRQSRPALCAAGGSRRAAGRSEQGDTRARLDAHDELRRSGAHDGGRGPGAAVVKVLVTGADGFVGRWVVRRLLGDGREVYGAVRPGQSPTPVAPAADLTPAEREAVRWLPLELLDAESVRKVVDLPYDAVVHLAAVSSGSDATRDPGYAWTVNAAGTARVVPVREFLHVRAVVDAYARLLVKGQPGETYNVASGQAVSLEELFFRLTDLIGARPIPEADPELVRGGDIFHLVGDAAKLRAATGWVPRYTLDDTLRDVLDAQAD